MSDLEDDLLALAGGDSGSELDVPLKRSLPGESGRKRAKTEADEDEDDDNDDDGDDDDGADHDDEDAVADEDDDDDAAEIDLPEDELVNPYPLEGKYRDEADRELLLAMDEIEREQTLFDRSQEMDRYNEKAYLQQRMRQQKEGQAKATRVSSRQAAATKLGKLDKFKELRKQREKASRRKDADFDEDEDEEDEEDEDEDEEEEDEEEGYDDEAVVWGLGKSKFRPRSFVKAGAEDVNKVRVGRSFLSKYMYYRRFAEAVVHTFGKINVGIDRRKRKPMYRAVQIEEVINVPLKQYKVGDTKTDIYVVVSQNRTQRKEFPINVFSDADISADEWERYVAELTKANEDVPYVDDVNDKAQELHDLMNSGLTNQDIDEIVHKKQQMAGEMRAYDAVYEKSRVLDEIKVAKQEGNAARVSELKDRLLELEKVLHRDSTRSAQSSSALMLKVNERNRKLNQEQIRRAELRSSALKKTSDALDGDPFSRLKTTTKVFYQSMVQEENQKALQDARDNYDNLIAEKVHQEEQIASSTYRELGEFDRLVASVEVNYVPVL